MDRRLSLEAIDYQESCFAEAFAAGDISLARSLYHADVVYVSPTTRLFGGARTIEGVDATLEFIQLTIEGCRNIEYRVNERAVLPGRAGAFALICFDWDAPDARLRSVYAVLYRYVEGVIGRQELYYDPGAQPELLGAPRS